jgi:CheY-like chemotaxis protein
MNLLLIEDDFAKSKLITNFLQEFFPKAQIQVFGSVNAAQKAIMVEKFDLVLVDMSLPTFSITSKERGGRPQVFGGRELMQYMKRKAKIIPAIVITQFEQFGTGEESKSLETLEEDLKREQGEIFKGLVYYNPTSIQWRSKLEKLLLDIPEFHIEANNNE